MARHSFGADLTAWTLVDDGSHIPLLTADVTITAWTAQTGGTAITDLSLDSAGTTPVDHITSANGTFNPWGTIPQFWGPDNVWSLWLSANGAPRLRIIANDLGDTIGVTVAATAADLATHEAARNPHLTHLDDLTDVAATSPTNGYALVYTTAGATWGPASMPTHLDDLTDVVIPSPNDGEAPVWQASSTSWRPLKLAPVTAVAGVQTASFTAVPGTLYPVSTTTASVTVTLPSAAAAGQVVTVYLTTTSATNTCTISRAGSDTINGFATSLPLAAAGDSVTLVSSGGGNTWWVTAGRAAATVTRVKCQRLIVQAVATSSFAQIQWTSADEYDTDNIHDPTFNADRIIFNKVGLWAVSYAITVAGSATGTRASYMQKNGTGGRLAANEGATAGTSTQSGTTQVTCSSIGDYVTVTVFQASGSALNYTGDVNSYFAAYYIGP